MCDKAKKSNKKKALSRASLGWIVCREGDHETLSKGDKDMLPCRAYLSMTNLCPT